MTLDEEVPAALAGERVDRIVALMTDLSRSDASRLLDNGGVSVDGSACRSGKLRLSQGQRVTVDMTKVPRDEPPQPDQSVELDIIHVDDDVVVLNKAAGMVVHPAPGHGAGTVVNGLLARFPEVATVGEWGRPGIVHRLDAGTTGLMLVARTDRAYAALVEALAAHEVEREYVALVWGHLDSSSLVVDAPIGRDPRDPLKMAVVSDGKWARTHVTREAQYSAPADLSLLKCLLETGRTHQIRVHLAAIGHPVVGDGAYGGVRGNLVVSRPMLHARRLSMRHPFTGESVSWEVPLPPDMDLLLGRLSPT